MSDDVIKATARACSWADVMAMEKAGGYLRRVGCSPKAPSPILDVDDVRELAAKEIARVTKEREETSDEEAALRDRLCDLLRDIAWVLRGEPPELSTWGFTGLDQRAAELIVERDQLATQVNDLNDSLSLKRPHKPVHRMPYSGDGPHGPRVDDI